MGQAENKSFKSRFSIRKIFLRAYRLKNKLIPQSSELLFYFFLNLGQNEVASFLINALALLDKKLWEFEILA